MPDFADHFSAAADAYARHRPGYPPALFDALAARCARTERAWDCATGSGQAAVALADRFDAVVATDASAQQVAHAAAHPRVTYRVAPAEASGLDVGSVDLVAVAQALHWFDRAAFFAEARRVLRPGGVLAAWTYGLCRVTPDVDALVEAFYRDTLGPYWPAERRLVEARYAPVAFPFDTPLRLPAFAMTAAWRPGDLLGYLGTWSATRRYREATGTDPLEPLARRLADRWPDDEARLVRWALSVHVGRVGKTGG